MVCIDSHKGFPSGPTCQGAGPIGEHGNISSTLISREERSNECPLIWLERDACIETLVKKWERGNAIG